MRRRGSVVPFVLVAFAAVAGGCAGAGHTSSNPAPGPLPDLPYAVFHVHGIYPARMPGTGERATSIDRISFTIACRPHTATLELGAATWRDRLCPALLDYQAAPRGRPVMCACRFATRLAVDVRGRIGQRRIRETFTACDCGLSRRGRRDVETILRAHPPVAIPGHR